MDEVPAALSIGAVFGGAYAVDELWRPHIQSLMRNVISAREGVSLPALCVNVVFHVEGELLPPLGYCGVRTGRYSRAHRHLMVQAALPPEPVADRPGVLLGLLAEAVSAAEDFARARDLGPDLPQVRTVLETVARP